MSSPVLTIVEEVKVKNHNKTKIGVGSAVKTKVGEWGISQGREEAVV